MILSNLLMRLGPLGNIDYLFTTLTIISIFLIFIIIIGNTSDGLGSAFGGNDNESKENKIKNSGERFIMYLTVTTFILFILNIVFILVLK